MSPGLSFLVGASFLRRQPSGHGSSDGRHVSSSPARSAADIAIDRGPLANCSARPSVRRPDTVAHVTQRPWAAPRECSLHGRPCRASGSSWAAGRAQSPRPRPVPGAHAHLAGTIRVLCAAVNFQDPARCSITVARWRVVWPGARASPSSSLATWATITPGASSRASNTTDRISNNHRPGHIECEP